MPKLLHIFSIKMATKGFTTVDGVFKIHADMTAVTIKYNKIVLNKVRQLSTTTAILLERNQMNFLVTQYYTFEELIPLSL